MEFTLDIRGEPWKPCAHCPHPQRGACPSRAVPSVCKRALRDPDFVATMPAETREPAHTKHLRMKMTKRGLVPENSAPLPNNTIVIRTYCDSWTGYGQIGEWLGRGLEQHGFSVRYVPIKKDETYFPVVPWQGERMADLTSIPAGVPILTLATPETDPIPGRPNIHFTMWESSGLSVKAVQCLNASRLVIVPCLWNAECFAKAGVKTPIRLVPLGYSETEGYGDDGSYNSGPVRFGMAFRAAHGGIRKGWREGIQAFLEAFPDTLDVQLAIKCFEDCAVEVPNDPRIILNRKALRPAELADWYRSIDALLVPSKGEGWGLHSLQAQACGRPIIAALETGTKEFTEPSTAYPLSYHWEPAGEFYAGQGDWVIPSRTDMVAALRSVYHDRETARSKGWAAARHVWAYQWEQTGAILSDVIREYLKTEAIASVFNPSADLERKARECGHRGAIIESGGGKACRERRLCKRDKRLVTFAECVDCKRNEALSNQANVNENVDLVQLGQIA